MITTAEPGTTSLERTPERVAAMYAELFSGMLRTVGFLAAIVLIAAGCGGSSAGRHDEGPTSSLAAPRVTVAHRRKSPAERAFIDGANAICATGSARIEALGTPPSASSSADETLAYAHALQAVLDDESKMIMSLPVPRGQEQLISMLIDNLASAKQPLDFEVRILEHSVQQPRAPEDTLRIFVADVAGRVPLAIKGRSDFASDYLITC